MVTRNATSLLMSLAWDIAYIYERSRSASTITPIQGISVKGQNFILEALKRWIPFVDYLVTYFPDLSTTRDDMKNWIAYLEKKYSEPTAGLLSLKNLDYKDAEQLSTDSLKWYNSIINRYKKRQTILINEENFGQIIPEDLLSLLDTSTKDDLNDGVNCILHLFPTPASMILFRVAESIVRKYYTKITGNPAGTKKWKDLLDELENSEKIKPSLLGYLHYIRDRRNEAEHPDKRFTQIESEQIFLHIKDLLQELRY